MDLFLHPVILIIFLSSNFSVKILFRKVSIMHSGLSFRNGYSPSDRMI